MTLPYPLDAIVELGLPVATLSWLLFYRLYSRGELDRGADHKTIRAGLKQIRKSAKRAGKAHDSILHHKWMRFGGGFYGVAAVWTLIVMEVSGIVSTLLHPQQLEAMFNGGIIGFVVNLLVNQFLTFMSALTWFTYWSNGHHDLFTQLAVAYGCYILGLNVARLEVPGANRWVEMDWRAELRGAFRNTGRKEKG